PVRSQRRAQVRGGHPGPASGSTTLHHFKQTIPEAAQRLSGTHEHLMDQAVAKPRLILLGGREWVPVLLRKPG
ncbi:hypothetical protein, partial [Phenylobacterium sp.]|uniref:hypothetical protein n=1 Tax=Phenylobacterium sp. TaxID=1871053 RepID=UPI0035AF8A0A